MKEDEDTARNGGLLPRCFFSPAPFFTFGAENPVRQRLTSSHDIKGPSLICSATSRCEWGRNRLTEWSWNVTAGGTIRCSLPRNGAPKEQDFSAKSQEYEAYK